MDKRSKWMEKKQQEKKKKITKRMRFVCTVNVRVLPMEKIAKATHAQSKN